MKQRLTIALPKGRVLQDTLPLFEEAGITPLEDISKSRKLIFDTQHEHVKIIVIRAVDVPTYVQYGAADLGVSGKDVLLEYGEEHFYEPLDLNIAKCRLMTAALKGKDIPAGRIKVASKYVNIAKRYFAEQGRQVDIIKLYGGMELAPVMGLADMIVDIVETGSTLKANGLEARDLITDISSRLIVNPAAMKTNYQQIQSIISLVSNAVARRSS